MRRALIACTAASLLGVVSALVDYGLSQRMLWSPDRSSLRQELAALVSALGAGDGTAARQTEARLARADIASGPDNPVADEDGEPTPLLAATMTPMDGAFPEGGPEVIQDVNRLHKADRLSSAEMSVPKLVMPEPERVEEGASAALFLLSPTLETPPMLAEASPAPAQPAAVSSPVVTGSLLKPGRPAPSPSMLKSQTRNPFLASATASITPPSPPKYDWNDLVRMASMKGGDGEEPPSIFGALSEKEFRARELRCMATAIYFEARGESVRGQTAVGQVIMTRVRSDFYPNTICGVVFQGQWNRNACQFSFACDGQTDAPKVAEQWTRALDVAKQVISGKVYLTDIADATHYHAVYVRPDWIRQVKRIKQIGVHIFYKAPFVNPLASDPAYSTM